MKTDKSFTFLFRKSPLFRTLSVLAVIAIMLAVISGITYKTNKTPVISSINPLVGYPGDIMIIKGANFGALKTSSDYVEVGGSKITASGFLSWTDSEIKLILPPNIQDGLVIVSTKAGKSKPSFFANEAGIPVEVPPDTKTALPVISSAEPKSAAVGNLLVLGGTNFGTVRNNAKVFFTAGRDNDTDANDESSYIPASETDYDYEYWSDSEVRIRVPDGAVSGQIYIVTEKGKSNYTYLEIKPTVGTKKYIDKKTYIIQLEADIDNISPKSSVSLSLRVPRPQQSSQQPVADLTECNPVPVFENYQNTIIHQLELSKTQPKKIRFNQSFVVETYAVQTQVNPKAARAFQDKTRALYTTYTAADSLINSDEEEYKSLASSIVKGEANPYLQAKLIYSYMLENWQLTSLRKQGSEPKDLIATGFGDAYDFSIVYITLLRSLNIPAIPVGGILIDSDLKTASHWWGEFYIENLGWVPVDIALGAGMEYKSFKNVDDPQEFYFGNIDSQHIAFSRGFNEIRPVIQNSHTVYFDRSYALQSIWEESSSGTAAYSSLWNIPAVLGIY